MPHENRTPTRALATIVASLAIVATATSVGPVTSNATAPPPVAIRAPSVSPSGEAMPVGDLPGWHQIFADDFTTDVPLGSFPAAVSDKWGAYPSPWKDTSGYGTYSPLDVVDINGGVLNKFVHTENGVAKVAALTPKLPGTSKYGLTYGRFATRFRNDSVPGYKMAWMLWPDSNAQRQDGEIDFPEADLDGSTLWGFMHRTNADEGGDQAWFRAPAVTSDWHTVVIEWSPNLVVFRLDGVEVGRTSERVPTTAMHWVLQTETEVELIAPPDATVSGNVQIDWLTAWAYDPATADTTKPILATTAPVAAATVSGAAVTVSANATDNVGVMGVQFKLDGINLGAEDTAAPYATTWNTTLGTGGAHTLTAVARDDAGNTNVPVPVPVVVNNTVDPTPPTFSPVPRVNGTVFPQTANIVASFSEAVTGVSASSFTLKNAVTGAAVPGVVTYAVSTTAVTATLNPSVSLAVDTKYTATLTPAIKDAAGNPLALTSWSFVTGPRPTATMSPLSGATGVNPAGNVTATFNEDVVGATKSNVTLRTSAGALVDASVTYDAATRTATLDPTARLAGNSTYTATLSSSIKDLVGNPLTAKTWTFTTGP